MPELNQRRSSRQKGDRGEDLALNFLAKKRCEALERNYRTRHGEIDLIVRDEAALVFVEVKLRRETGLGDPLEAVTPKKQARIRFTAEQYLAEQGEDFVAGFDELRFDVVGILVSGAGKPEIQRVENAF